MKRFLLLLLIAGITFALVAMYRDPTILNDIWLWLVGLLGTIIQLVREFFDYIDRAFGGDEEKEVEKTAEELVTGKEQPAAGAPATVNAALASAPVVTAVPEATTPKADLEMRLLRYSDDGQTTVGLLYLADQFYCYTLEDTFHKVKVPGETRIPAGTYEVKFMPHVTPLTEKYRTRYPEWFTFHLHLQNVPNFTGIYIHNGGTFKDTEGCILVSDSLTMSDEATFLSNSRNTFKMLYQHLSTLLNQQKRIIIKVQDEKWAQELAS